MQSAYAASAGLPAYTGRSPRATASNYQSHRGDFVSIVVLVQENLPFTCAVTEQVLPITGVPDTAEVSRVCEFILYVHPATGALIYFQHSLLDDEFDFEVYRRLLKISAQYPELF